MEFQIPVTLNLTKKQAQIISRADFGGIHNAPIDCKLMGLYGDSGKLVEVNITIDQLPLEGMLIKAAQEKLK